MEELYHGEEIVHTDIYLENEEEVETDAVGPKILKSEFTKALKELSNRKATGTDSIPAEILKNMGEKTKDLLFDIVQECYCYGNLPPDFVKSKTLMPAVHIRRDFARAAECESEL